MNQVDSAGAPGAHTHHDDRPRTSVAKGGPFLRRRGRRAATFLWHLLQMCIAMCIGMMALGGPYFAVARLLGYSDPARQLPELSALVMAVNMTVPMAAWMRYRMRHDRRCIAEMAGAMGVEAVLVIGAAWLGLLSRSDIVSWEHTLMVPAMLVPMLYRLDLYTGGAIHGAHAGPHPSGAPG